MKEGFEIQQKNIIPLADLDSVSGREIEGLDLKEEKFLPLNEGEDFHVESRNEKIKSEKSLQDFIVFISPSMGTETKTVEAPHWRAINDSDVSSSIEVYTEDGSPHTEYFYGVSTKGIGYLKPTAKDINIEAYDTWTIEDTEGVNDEGYKVLGLISKEEAVGGNLIEKSEKLLSQGLRTELYWGIVSLKKIPFQGQMLTVEELKSRKVLSPRESYAPYEVVRLFKMNNRIAEAAQSDERRMDLFKKAFEVFNKEAKDKNWDLPEVSIGNSESVYFQEFFKHMGHNMATLLNNGLDHGYMHSANVTLSAEIADVGTIDHWTKEKNKDNQRIYGGVRRSHIKDMRDMCYGLRMLIKAGKKARLDSGSRIELEKAFFTGFDELFNSEKVDEQETNSSNARQWMKKIFDTVIIKAENLPALLHNDVEDWSIEVS